MPLTGRSKATIVVNVVFPVLAIIAVAFRLYARKLKALRLQADDYVILLALVITVASSIPYIIGGAIGGIGEHLPDLTDEQFVINGKILFATQFLYIGSVTPIKLSILLFYKRIFSTRKFKIAVYVVAVCVILWFIAFIFATLFQASPISYNWTGVGTPVDFTVLYEVIAATDLFLDIVILTMPWPMIWGLQMTRSRKLFVTGIFMLGGFVVISSAVRLSYLVQSSSPASLVDFTYGLTFVVIWTAIEPCTSIICACLPTYGPIFHAHTPESLIGSVKHYFQLSYWSRSNQSKSSGWGEKAKPSADQASNSSSGGFHKMSEDQIIHTNIEGTQLQDLEAQRLPSAGISVKTDLSSVDNVGAVNHRTV